MKRWQKWTAGLALAGALGAGAWAYTGKTDTTPTTQQTVTQTAPSTGVSAVDPADTYRAEKAKGTFDVNFDNSGEAHPDGLDKQFGRFSINDVEYVARAGDPTSLDARIARPASADAQSFLQYTVTDAQPLTINLPAPHDGYSMKLWAPESTVNTAAELGVLLDDAKITADELRTLAHHGHTFDGVEAYVVMTDGTNTVKESLGIRINANLGDVVTECPPAETPVAPEYVAPVAPDCVTPAPVNPCPPGQIPQDQVPGTQDVTPGTQTPATPEYVTPERGPASPGIEGTVQDAKSDNGRTLFDTYWDLAVIDSFTDWVTDMYILGGDMFDSVTNWSMPDFNMPDLWPFNNDVTASMTPVPRTVVFPGSMSTDIPVVYKAVDGPYCSTDGTYVEPFTNLFRSTDGPYCSVDGKYVEPASGLFGTGTVETPYSSTSTLERALADGPQTSSRASAWEGCEVPYSIGSTSSSAPNGMVEAPMSPGAPSVEAPVASTSSDMSLLIQRDSSGSYVFPSPLAEILSQNSPADIVTSSLANGVTVTTYTDGCGPFVEKHFTNKSGQLIYGDLLPHVHDRDFDITKINGVPLQDIKAACTPSQMIEATAAYK